MEKNKKHLNREQRDTIFRMLQAGCTKKMICVATGKDKSVIGRGIETEHLQTGYSPGTAQLYADERKERFRGKRKFTPEIERRVTKRLSEEQRSPEQIAGRCHKNGIPTVSHERIYQYIRQDKQKGGTLWKHCRAVSKLTATERTTGFLVNFTNMDILQKKLAPNIILPIHTPHGKEV